VQYVTQQHVTLQYGTVHSAAMIMTYPILSMPIIRLCHYSHIVHFNSFLVFLQFLSLCVCVVGVGRKVPAGFLREENDLSLDRQDSQQRGENAR
jgi:hypothetical protein